MNDFMTTSQKISIANRKFVDLSRSNHHDVDHNNGNDDDWVTCDQASLCESVTFKQSLSLIF